MACSVKAELEAQVVAEQEKHKDTHDKYERAACAEHRHTSPHTWEQFWIVRALGHGYESFGLCCVHRRSMERCWLPRRTAGRSRRIRSRSSGTTSRSQSAEPLRRAFPRIPMRAHSSPARASIRGQAEGPQRYGADTTCGATAKPVRACLCTLHGITSPSRRTSHVQGECRVASECVDATCACASVSARGRFGSAVPHGRLV